MRRSVASFRVLEHAVTNDEFHRSLESAPNWWIVRGESGALWSALFKVRGVVAHGSQVERFQIDASYEDRNRALLALDSYGVLEVNDFHDEMDIDDVVVTPDAGSREGWFGIITSGPFADNQCDHWIQRRCEWNLKRMTFTSEAAVAIPKMPLGTIFRATKSRNALLDSFVRSLA